MLRGERLLLRNLCHLLVLKLRLPCHLPELTGPYLWGSVQSEACGSVHPAWARPPTVGLPLPPSSATTKGPPLPPTLRVLPALQLHPARNCLWFPNAPDSLFWAFAQAGPVPQVLSLTASSTRQPLALPCLESG